MPLRPPALDDRSFDDLLQDLLAAIPAHTPEWTSPQVGDPGRTLLELFAWLGDALLYRANLIPEKQRLQFLKLIGLPLQAASAARGMVSLLGDPADTGVVSLAPASVLKGPVAFETLGGMDLLPVAGEVYVKAKLSHADAAAAQSLLSGLRTLYKLGATPTGYYTQQLFGNGVADPQGLDLLDSTLDGSLWIALLAPKPDAATRQAVIDALGGKNAVQRILNVGFVPAVQPADPLADLGPRTAVQHTWQLSLVPGADGKMRFDDLKVFDDTTQGLTQAGVIRLALPQASDIGAPSNDVKLDAQAGVGPKPPRLDDADRQQRLITWVRLKVSSHLVVSWAGVNAVEIDQRTTQTALTLGVSDGSPNQQFALPVTQVESGSFQLEVDMPGIGPQLWQQVDDLAVLNGPALAYTLDPEAGLVTTGDNLRGMIPPLGRRVRVRSMRSGGGAAGNLPAGTLKAISANDADGKPIQKKITVTQPVATTGGADAESLDAAQRRIPSWLRHRDRAVTATDYYDLVEQIPGASVGRVEVLPLFKPQTRTENVPGVVSVMVIPQKEGFQPPCPRADRPLLNTVFHYLNPRKPVAAELYVIGTEYVGIGIAMAVEVLAGFDLRVVSQQVEDALRRFLWPLEPGGTAQSGWPLNRNVRSLELDVIASQVRGVAEINGTQLYTLQAGKSYQAVAAGAGGQQEVTIKSYQLPELLRVTVTPGPEGSGISPVFEPSPEPSDGVAVPVVPKVC